MKKINEYFKICEEKKKPPTMSGLALALGLERKELVNLSEKAKNYNKIKIAKMKIMQDLEERAIEKGGTAILFLIKEYGGEIDFEQDMIINFSIPRPNKENQEG